MKTILIAVLAVTNAVCFAAYVSVAVERNDYRGQISRAEDAIRSLPDRQKYFIGEEKNGDLLVYCVDRTADPTIRGGSGDDLILNITCGEN
jgi:hypothetical protein